MCFAGKIMAIVWTSSFADLWIGKHSCGSCRRLSNSPSPSSDCKVLLDLQEITCDLGLEDLVELKAELSSFPWTAVGKLKLAMVTTPHPEQYHGLRQLTLPVSQLGVDVAAFCESRRAIEWLAEETNLGFC